MSPVGWWCRNSSTRNTNPGLQPFGYAGGLLDLDGRFVHFGARDYDARTSQRLEPDPIGAAGGGNRFGYAGNDPVNRVDPTGLCVEDFCIAEALALYRAARTLYNIYNAPHVLGELFKTPGILEARGTKSCNRTTTRTGRTAPGAESKQVRARAQVRPIRTSTLQPTRPGKSVDTTHTGARYPRRRLPRWPRRHSSELTNGSPSPTAALVWELL